MSDDKPRKAPDILTLAMRKVYRERMDNGRPLPRIRLDTVDRGTQRKTIARSPNE